MKGLFGTDGIRGEVGQYPLTQEAVFITGRTLGVWLKEQYLQVKSPLKILIGKDTRQSGDELELALSKGAGQEGLEVLPVGVCPTPMMAYLTSTLHVHLGIAISASHNPCSDNGIKFFDLNGYKLSSPAERRIEEIFFSFPAKPINLDTSASLKPRPLRRDRKAPFSINPECSRRVDVKSEQLTVGQDYLGLYLNFVKNSLGCLNLAGLKVVIDCAFGSFSEIAPRLFQDLGASAIVLNNKPDGKNINVNCGTLYPQAMVKAILQHRADIGVAFDGDGDRVIVADENGNVFDGDHILAILTDSFLTEKRLGGNTVICTQMSNIGLELYLQRQGIRMIRTEVGDKYVLGEMLKYKANLGGEQSGHIIILEHTTTGDGLIVALELIKAMLKNNKPLSQICPQLERLPQVLVNVKVREKKPLEEITGLSQALEHSRKQLGKSGRLLVRYSGTENLARIMVEGRQSSLIKQVANAVAQIIQDAVGQR